MTNNRNKYSPEFRKETVEYVLTTGKSALRASKELGIGVSTLQRWLAGYRKTNDLPSSSEERGTRPRVAQTDKNLLDKLKETEKALKLKDKELNEEREKVEILKKSLHIFMQPRE